MGRISRRREQRGNAERSGRSGAGAPMPSLSHRPKPRWRETLDEWGGLPVLGVLALVVAGLVFFALRAWPDAASTDDLMGEAVMIGAANHVVTAVELDIPQGQPPADGPHFASPLRPGIYDFQVVDGNVIHSLEHGMVWISYRHDQIAAEDLKRLTEVAQDYSDDVVLSPRVENTDTANIVSWGRRMTIKLPVDKDDLAKFIKTNRNRSPEPGIR